MGSIKVCVVGWYEGKHRNLGDEAFKPSFQKLWGNYSFTFKNYIPENINDYDLCWFKDWKLRKKQIESQNKFLNDNTIEITAKRYIDVLVGGGIK